MGVHLTRKKFTIVCGHYGSGKTNLSMNMAIECARKGEKVTLIDLDIVNPYFRSSDYSELLTKAGVEVIGPNFANTNLDTPSLPASIEPIISGSGRVIVDVGGDDAGAMALGRYSGPISKRDYDMFYVINRYRSLTMTPNEAAQILVEIESVSHLKATAIVNNSHLKQLTTAETISDSLDYADATAEMLGLPIIFTTAPRNISDSLNKVVNIHPIDVYVTTPWEKEQEEHA